MCQPSPETKLFKFPWNFLPKKCVLILCSCSLKIILYQQPLECNKGSQNVKCFIKCALWEQNNPNFTHQKHIKHFKRDAPQQEPLENKHALKVFYHIQVSSIQVCFQSFIFFFLNNDNSLMPRALFILSFSPSPFQNPKWEGFKQRGRDGAIYI